MINLSKKTVKYIYLEMTIQHGEYQHEHRVMFATSCTNIEFAVCWYIAHYWGEAERDEELIWLNSEMVLESYTVKQLKLSEYRVMYDVMYN